MEMKIQLPDYVRRLMARYETIGEEVYLVGGSLRDLLLGITPHDYDLASSATPERTAALFSDLRVIETGIKHGTVTVLFEGNPVEITTFRVDGGYADSRHPDRVTFTGQITEDLARRDFTVNAMAYHEKTGLVDPFGGQADLSAKILRAVGDPNLRFREDALRIMRAFRFSAQLGFQIHKDTLQGCIDSKGKLTNIAKERIAAEFVRLLLSDFPYESLCLMAESGILEFVLPNYVPKQSAIDRIARMPREDVARLGLYFSDTDEQTAAQLLRELKCSNKQITGTCAVLRGSALPIESPADARRLRALCGAYAPLAAHASVLLGHSPEEAIAWASAPAPATIADLAVSGKDLMTLGLSGKEVGDTLKKLLEIVLDDPEKNEKEILISLAKDNP